MAMALLSSCRKARALRIGADRLSVCLSVASAAYEVPRGIRKAPQLFNVFDMQSHCNDLSSTQKNIFKNLSTRNVCYVNLNVRLTL